MHARDLHPKTAIFQLTLLVLLSLLLELDEENVVCTKLNSLTFDSTYDDETKSSDETIGENYSLTTNDDSKTKNVSSKPETGISKTDDMISKTDNDFPIKNYHLYGRSMSLSIDNGYEGKRILHSIIKERKGESAYFYDKEDEEDISCSVNSLNEDSDFNESPPPACEPKLGRRRIKSVTFNDEPTIFEFAKLTKRQFKKQQKEEKQQKARESKIIAKQTPSEQPAASNDEETGVEETNKKTKKKNKYEKKGRSYSDGLLQVPNSFLARHKKKSKNKKNKDDSEESPTNSFTDLTESPNENAILPATPGELFDTSESDFITGEVLI